MTPASVHASAVKVGDRGVLIRGASGAGKSSLVLQILSADPDGCILVADDQVTLSAAGGRVMAAASELLAGLMEIRGQGILRLPYISPAAIDLIVDIAAVENCPRMPRADERQVDLLGIVLPRIFLARGAVDGGARIRAALRWQLYENA